MLMMETNKLSIICLWPCQRVRFMLLWGPNGAGKSTLSYVLTGKPGYDVTGGEVLLSGESLLDFSPEERAAKGDIFIISIPD